MPSTGVWKFFARGCRIVGCNKVCSVSLTMLQGPKKWGPFPYDLGLTPSTSLPSTLKVNPQYCSFRCHFLLWSPRGWGVLLSFMFLEFIREVVIPVRISAFLKDVNVNMPYILLDLGVLPPEKAETLPNDTSPWCWLWVAWNKSATSSGRRSQKCSTGTGDTHVHVLVLQAFCSWGQRMVPLWETPLRAWWDVGKSECCFLIVQVWKFLSHSRFPRGVFFVVVFVFITNGYCIFVECFFWIYSYEHMVFR